MDVLKKIVGREVKDEKDYFDAMWAVIDGGGKLLSLGGILSWAMKHFPENIALIYNDRQMPYKELYWRASLFSSTLREKGIKPRDRVLLFFENSLEFYVGYFGIVQTGAVIAPLNIFLHENELEHIIKDSMPTCVVTHSTHVELFTKHGHQNSVKILTEQDMNLIDPVPQEVVPFDVYPLAPDEMAALLYTSGTTGLPKGVMLSSKNIMTNLVQAMARFNLRSCQRVFGVLPLFHSFAQNTCVWASMFTGSTVIVVPKIERRYIFDGLKHKPTLVLGVPALYGLFCLMKNAPFSDVHYFASGGDALPDRIRMAFALVYRRKLVNGYGLTEASPVVAATFDDLAMPTSTIGRPMVNMQIALIDDQGKEVKQGNIGQLIVKGDNVMLGYYNAPELTAQTIKDGWLYTGDLAYLDEKGNIVITGRIKDVIKHKGFMIYPQEVENIISSDPNVIRVGIVGKPDVATGEIPVAFVQVRSHEPHMEKKLRELCLQHLAPYKIPKQFIITTENLAITATGKVDKKVLRKQLNHH
jgi:long-chain acyl-CoA synthetase